MLLYTTSDYYGIIYNIGEMGLFLQRFLLYLLGKEFKNPLLIVLKRKLVYILPKMAIYQTKTDR